MWLTVVAFPRLLALPRQRAALAGLVHLGESACSFFVVGAIGRRLTREGAQFITRAASHPHDVLITRDIVGSIRGRTRFVTSQRASIEGESAAVVA